VRDWYGSPVEQQWRGAVQYVEQQRSASEPVLVYPGFLTAPVDYYARDRVETADVLQTNAAWIVSVGDRASEIEQLVADSGYEVSERTNFASVDVWHVSRPAG
jgi:hypothetical protein